MSYDIEICVHFLVALDGKVHYQGTSSNSRVGNQLSLLKAHSELIDHSHDCHISYMSHTRDLKLSISDMYILIINELAPEPMPLPHRDHLFDGHILGLGKK